MTADDAAAEGMMLGCFMVAVITVSVIATMTLLGWLL